MRHRQLLLWVAASLCSATTPLPFHLQCSLLDRISEIARPGTPKAAVVLNILERVAEGRMEGENPDLEPEIGLQPGQLRGPEFKDATVRAHAFRRIGRIDLPAA